MIHAMIQYKIQKNQKANSRYEFTFWQQWIKRRICNKKINQNNNSKRSRRNWTLGAKSPITNKAH